MALTCIKAPEPHPCYVLSMDVRCRQFRFVLFLGLIAQAFVSCSKAPKNESHRVTGVVREKLSESSLLIAHDEIPGFMAPMTMAFDLADPKDSAKLNPGDRVRFRLQQKGELWMADRFEVLGRETSSGAGLAKVTRLRPGDAMPPFSLRDERDQPLALETLHGRFTLVTFIFTRCPVPEFCPAMALKFGALQERIERETQTRSTPSLRLLSITLDPEYDQPPQLAAYGTAVGAKPAIWNFATGTSGDIATLARQFSVFTERKGVLLDHTLCTALIGPEGRILEIWRGNGWKPDDIFGFIETHPRNSR